MAAEMSKQVADDAFDRFAIEKGAKEGEKIELPDCIDRKWKEAIPAYAVGKLDEGAKFYLTTDEHPGAVGNEAEIHVNIIETIQSGGYTIVCKAELGTDNASSGTYVILKQAQAWSNETVDSEFKFIKDIERSKKESGREDVKFSSVSSQLREVYQVNLEHQGNELEVHLIILNLIGGATLGTIISEQQNELETQGFKWISDNQRDDHFKLTLKVIISLCKNVGFLHKTARVAHFDLHSNNIIVDRETGQSVIIDFDRAIELKLLKQETERMSRRTDDVTDVCMHGLDLLIFLSPEYETIPRRKRNQVTEWMKTELMPYLHGNHRKVADKIYEIMKLIGEKGEKMKSSAEDDILNLDASTEYFEELLRREEEQSSS